MFALLVTRSNHGGRAQAGARALVGAYEQVGRRVAAVALGESMLGGRVVDEELDARTISVDLDGVKVRDDGATVAPGLGAYWSSHPEPKKQRLWG